MVKISSDEAMVMMLGATAGAMIAYKFGPKEGKPVYIACAAVAMAAIALIIYKEATKQKVGELCKNGTAGECAAALASTGVSIVPELIQIISACGSGNVATCGMAGYKAVSKASE